MFELSCSIQMCNRGFNPGFAFLIFYFYFTSGWNCSVTASHCHGCVSQCCGALDRRTFFLALICSFLWVWPVALIRLNPSILLCVRLTYENYSQSLTTFLVVSELDLLKTGLRNTSPCIYPEDFYVKCRIAPVRKCFSSVSEPPMPWKSYCWACRFITPGGADAPLR